MPEETVAARDSRGLALALLLLFAVLVLRCPFILLHGRMWGEELTTFLAQAWNRPFSTALLAQHFGYYSLWDNVLYASFVHFFPLRWLALLLTWSAVVNLLLTGYLVYEAECFTTRTAKTLAVLLMVLTAPNGEVYLNMLNSEFFFGLWALVILLSDPTRLRWQRLLALLVAGLSGPLTTLLAPVFALRAIVTRRRPHVIQAAIVVGTGILQIAVALASRMSGRRVGLNPAWLGPVVLNKDFILLFLTRAGAKVSFLFLRDHLHFSVFAIAGCWVVLLAVLAGMVLLLRPSWVALLMFGLALWMTVLEFSLSLNSGLESVSAPYGERYAFVPNMLIVWALLVLVTAHGGGVRRQVAYVLLALSFASGLEDALIMRFRAPEFWRAEPWSEQVRQWQADPTRKLHCLPDSSCGLYLPPRA